MSSFFEKCDETIGLAIYLNRSLNFTLLPGSLSQTVEGEFSFIEIDEKGRIRRWKITVVES